MHNCESWLVVASSKLPVATISREARGLWRGVCRCAAPVPPNEREQQRKLRAPGSSRPTVDIATRKKPLVAHDTTSPLKDRVD